MREFPALQSSKRTGGGTRDGGQLDRPEMNVNANVHNFYRVLENSSSLISVGRGELVWMYTASTLKKSMALILRL